MHTLLVISLSFLILNSPVFGQCFQDGFRFFLQDKCTGENVTSNRYGVGEEQEKNFNLQQSGLNQHLSCSLAEQLGLDTIRKDSETMVKKDDQLCYVLLRKSHTKTP
eukprot:1139855-Pelagomonas_calceolata.AAC.1